MLQGRQWTAREQEQKLESHLQWPRQEKMSILSKAVGIRKRNRKQMMLEQKAKSHKILIGVGGVRVREYDS